MPIERLFRILKGRLEELVDSELNRREKKSGGYSSYEEDYRSSSQRQKDPVEEKEVQYYANLELEPTTDFSKIKAQYRTLMKKYHPDRFNGNEVKIEMARMVTSKLNEAYNYFEKKFKP